MNTVWKRVAATLAALLLTVGMTPWAVFGAAETVYFTMPEPETYASAAGNSDEKALLASYVSLEELEAYLRPKFMNCEKTIDLSSFKFPANQALLGALYHYAHYYMSDCFQFDRILSATTSGGVMLRLNVQYYDFADTAEELAPLYAAFERAANTLLAGVEGNTALSDTEKALLLHDRLALWNEYDCNTSVVSASFSSYGALVKRVSVCQGYAFAYHYLLKRVGIDSDYARSDTLNHIWNVVYIDGEAYHVDVTWDDPIWDITGRVSHHYFLLSSDALYRARAAAGSVATDFDQTPNSTRFDNAYWQDSDAAFQLAGGALYYIDSRASMLRRVEGEQRRDVLSVKDAWESNGLIWLGNYARLSSDGRCLLYSLSDAVYKYDPTAGVSEAIYHPDLSIGADFSIYGFMYEGGYLICDRNCSPNFEADTRARYQVRAPYDTQPPTARVTSTSAVAATQTVTLTLADNAAVAGYYWGTDPVVGSNPYFAETASSVTQTVTQPGTYYLTAKDAMGNLSETQVITFYRTALDAAGGLVTPASVLTPAGASFVLPQPSRNGYTFKNWQATNGAVTNGTLTPTASGKCTAVWERLPAVVQAVEVVTPPQKTVYYRGDALDTTGLRLRLIYDYGEPNETDAFESVSGYDPHALGVQTITVTCAGRTTTFDVTVKAPSLTLSAEAKALRAGETAALKAFSTPEGAQVTWSSSNPTVVSVADGALTAHADGSATITASFAYNGQIYTATCAVTVGCRHAACAAVAARASTCRERGWEAYQRCDDCGQIFSADGTTALEAVPYRPLADHSGGRATCTERAVCDVCGEPYGERLPHNCGALVPEQAATHQQAGMKAHYQCRLCGGYFDAAGEPTTEQALILPMIPHTFGADWVTSAEQHWHACSCGAQQDAAAHTFTWVIDREATEETPGEKHEVCAVCNFVRGEGTIIPPLNHHHTLTHVAAVAPTGETAGHVEYWTCEECGLCFADAEATREISLDDTIILPIAPRWGDVNNDGQVDTADAVLVLQYAAELIGADALNLAAADVNGDQERDTADAVLILQRVAELITAFPVEMT